MSWILAVLARIVFANVIFPVALKRNTFLGDLRQRMFLQFALCAAATVLFAAVTGYLRFSLIFVAIVLTGLVSSLATYAQWQAVNISLSKTSLFTFWDDIIGMGLGLVVFHEARALNLGVLVGITISLGVVVLYVLHSMHQHRGSGRQLPMRFFLYVGVYSLIWGVVFVLHKLFGVSGVPVPTFLAAWYIGTVIGSASLLTARRQLAWSFGQTLEVLPLSASIIGSLAFGYVAYRQAPINVVQPLFLVGEMFFPAIIGFIVFHEAKTMTWKEWVLASLALVGGTCIAVSFH